MIAVPPDLADDPELQTRELFRLCVGKVFTIVDVDQVAGFGRPLIQLDVGEVLGREPSLETIWIEPVFVEPVA